MAVLFQPDEIWENFREVALQDFGCNSKLSHEIRKYIDEIICKAFKRYCDSIGVFVSDQELEDILNG